MYRWGVDFDANLVAGSELSQQPNPNRDSLSDFDFFESNGLMSLNKCLGQSFAQN